MAKGKSKPARKAKAGAKAKPMARAAAGKAAPARSARRGAVRHRVAASRGKPARKAGKPAKALKKTKAPARAAGRAGKPVRAAPAGKGGKAGRAPAPTAQALKGRMLERVRPGRRPGGGNGDLPKSLDPKDLRKSKMPHIDDATLAKIVARLLEMRTESKSIINHQMQSDLNQQVEGTDVGDDLDLAVTERDREFNLIMHQRHLRRMNQIDEALQRIVEGSYGYCEGTEEPINPKRLLIQPLARYSLEYQEQQEKMLGRSPEDMVAGGEEPMVPEE